jgi:hypothetical protein
MPVRCQAAALVAVVTLLLPSAALAQGSAGDNQYQDPFAGSGGSGHGGSGQGGSGHGSGHSGSGHSTSGHSGPGHGLSQSPGNMPPGDSTQSTVGSGQLPYTGANAGLILLAGVGLLLTGVGLRLRLPRG